MIKVVTKYKDNLKQYSEEVVPIWQWEADCQH